MIHTGKRIHAQTSFYGQRVDFYLFNHDELGKRQIAHQIDFEPFQDGSFVKPSFEVPLECAQEFFEELWAQGFRSAHDKGNADALDGARKEHIADLRKAAKLA